MQLMPFLPCISLTWVGLTQLAPARPGIRNWAFENLNLVLRGLFCHALEIGTPGQVQRDSGFEWLCKHNRLRPEPTRFDSEHAQSDGKSMNRGLPELDLAKGCDLRR